MTGTGATRTAAVRRAVTVTAAVAASLSSASAPAWVGPVPNGHNCAGQVVSAIAGPAIGGVVSAGAQEQAIDNFGQADCGAPPRRNP